MPAMNASLALNFLPLLLLLAAISEATTINITNRCSYTVWPAVLPASVGGGAGKLNPGQVWTLDVPAGTAGGRIWARTGCSFNGGKGSCQTGDCGGALTCSISGNPPNTLAEFSTGTQDFFDISVVHGFNVPIDFLPVPVQGEKECSEGPRCSVDITSRCPKEIKVPGGCNNTCAGTRSGNCTYSGFFKSICPNAYSLPNDDATYACPAGTNYQVIFCPPINLVFSPAAMSPLPTPTPKTTPSPSSPPPAAIGPTRTKPRVTNRVVAILASVGSFILVTVLFIISFYICIRRARRKHQEMEEEEEFGELQGTPMRFTFQQLKVATEQFSDKLGEGGFGSVFKGQLGEDSIAVKRLDHAGQGKREFSAEVQTIGSIHHINLVRLIGFCVEKSHRLLVYEYMPKGSLDRWIYHRPDNNAPPLDWSTRCKIIIHIAKGLSYLHEECTKRIAHLDVKPQNILLDDNFNAKLSDFGLCKLIDRDISQVVTRMRGTPGYLAPEWLTSQITEKADIYTLSPPPMAPPLIVRILLLLAVTSAASAASRREAFRRDPGNAQWHHGAFHDVEDSVRADVRRMLHTRAEVPFQVPLEVNVVLIGFNGDGGYRYPLDGHKLEQFLKMSFPLHRPSCFETGEPVDIEHHIMYNVIAAGQPELISLEKSLKEAMVSAGTARESEYGREFPLFEVEATAVEHIFERLYSFIFDIEPGRSATEMDRPVPVAIFVVNFDKVRMDPRNKGVDLDSLMYSTIGGLTEQELKKQEADYIYRYRYNGGGATQVWLSSGRFVVIDLSAGPCTYGKIETEEGSVSYRSMPRLSNIIFPRGLAAPSASSTQNIFMGQLGGLISTTIEHVIAPDIRFETVDMTLRLLVPIIVLQNHNRYNILQAGHNTSIDVQAIEREVKKMVHAGQEVIVISGSHALHEHEKLAVAVSKAMRSHSLHETKSDGRFHVHTKTYLDGAILKEEMERSADVLSAGLLQVADPSLSSRFFLKQHWMEEQDNAEDSIKHKPIWESYVPRNKKEKRGAGKKKHGTMYKTYGTRVIPVFVLSLAEVDAELMLEEESLVWTSKDVVIVLEHNNKMIPLSYVSETTRRFAYPSLAQRHILAGLASAVGGLSAPYERVSRVHERPILNWLWSAGCHPFGPFSNSSQISQILQDVALRTTIYARVDAALRKIRDTSESVQSFASDHLKTPLGEPVKGNKNKSSTELWVEKFYKKVTTIPEPFPHDLVERLEEYLDRLEGQLVDLSSLLYDHRLVDASQNSSDILQSTIFTEQYVERVLSAERDKMKCCRIEYSHPKQSSQAFVYGGILLAGFLVYSLVIFFSSPVR